jgi:hypothetical protein
MAALRSPIIAEDANFDPNRMKGQFAPHSSVPGGVDFLAFLVGPVVVTYDGDPAKSAVGDLARYISKDKRVIRTVTGQIEMNLDRGICTIDAPKAQGACGFLGKAGQVKLTDLSIQSQNEYVAVLAVSLDGKDLVEAGRILVQVTTRCRPYGWKQRPAGRKDYEFEIVDTGSVPWNVENTRMSIELRRGRVRRADLLDANFLPIRSLDLQLSADGPVHLTLPPEAMYVLLR